MTDLHERWANYFTNVNDKLASIAVDLRLRIQTPVKTRPCLLWAWVYLQSPRPDGLSARSEFDTLCAIEDKLVDSLGRECRAVEAGRITSDGCREFYFYGTDDTKLEAAVSNVMREFPQYRYEGGSQDDSSWGHYLNVLYPTDEDFEKIKNGDVLAALREQGDSYEAVRDVTHWIYFRTADQRQQYALVTDQLGYKIAAQTEREAGEEHPFGLQITRDQSVTPTEIDSAVIELYRLANQFDADYDGWETRVVPSAQT